MAYELAPLPYAFDALEPYIDAATMEIHHDKHHAAYVAKLNAALEGHDDLAAKSPEELIVELNSLPEAVRGAVRNNGGGHVNHTMFWSIMGPNGGGEPTGAIADAINAKWGSFAAFQEELNDKAVNNFGSSWTWLVKNADGSLEIVNTSNAGTPMTEGQTALLTVDLWEHAYYIDFRNVRPNYLEAFWKLVNWDFVNENFAA